MVDKRANWRDRFKIEDKATVSSSPTVAWACVRLDRLRDGYRFIHLKDMKGETIRGGRLFVRTTRHYK